MTLIETLKTCLSNYVTFSGRAPRTEFWRFLLLVWMAVLITRQVRIGYGTLTSPQLLPSSQAPIEMLLAVALLPAVAAAASRRLHDTGRSAREALYLVLATLVFLSIGIGLETRGAGQVHVILFTLFALTGLILFAAWLRMIYLLSCPSQPGPNQYGPNPTEVTP
ncbi:DUF805 domain-containing protein [uncultured Roseobacter sp.]|uniref:DUF805 domain-containing protein n=1 Tax=uncultured Roseobacter sp. TaxID=114847 RepID=UPI00345DEECB